MGAGGGETEIGLAMMTNINNLAALRRLPLNEVAALLHLEECYFLSSCFCCVMLPPPRVHCSEFHTQREGGERMSGGEV